MTENFVNQSGQSGGEVGQMAPGKNKKINGEESDVLPSQRPS
jgi:hypothetical protein